MIQTTLCSAIHSRTIVQFNYMFGDDPGIRVVEPHMVARTKAGYIALSAWYLRGHSESRDGQGWREYLLSGIYSVIILDETFPGPRRGYNRTGGKSFHNVQCAL